MVRQFLKALISYLFIRIKIISQDHQYYQYRLKYKLNSSFKFNGENILFYGNGNIDIGKNSYMGSYSTIQTIEGTFVKIGENCRISHNVRIYTTTNIVDQDFNNEKIIKKSESVSIGNAVWIGANVFINPGVTIGDNAIIGANSVVAKSIPPNAIAGGVPAKVIRFKSLNA